MRNLHLDKKWPFCKSRKTFKAIRTKKKISFIIIYFFLIWDFPRNYPTVWNLQIGRATINLLMKVSQFVDESLKKDTPSSYLSLKI